MCETFDQHCSCIFCEIFGTKILYSNLFTGYVPQRKKMPLNGALHLILADFYIRYQVSTSHRYKNLYITSVFTFNNTSLPHAWVGIFLVLVHSKFFCQSVTPTCPFSTRPSLWDFAHDISPELFPDVYLMSETTDSVHIQLFVKQSSGLKVKSSNPDSFPPHSDT